ncbi:Nuclear envelope morphology protein 1, partial [Ascosphaera atra]
TGKGEARGRGHNAKSPSQTVASVDFKAYFRVDRKLLYLAQRLVDTLTTAVKAILATLAAPAVYVARTFRTDEGRYSALAPLRRLRRRIGRAFGRSPARGDDVTAPYSSPLESLSTEKPSSSGRRTATGSRRSKRDSPYRTPRRSPSADSLSSNASETDTETKAASRSKSPNASSSSSSPSSSLSAPARRSIRIEVSDEGNRSRRRNSVPIPEDDENIDLSAADMLKSPMSSSHKLTRYPQAYPVPPRPLIPPRQPSYSEHNRRYPQKTLVLDLDETLIHSLAKGGRMSSGHMVEVRLSSPVAVAPPTTSPSGQAQAQTPAMLGLQHPILYYVHKRPHCDDFLRKVCKWYRLVIFTASVQEYADPVIDWLEQERKYFHTRYYRQHCTFRNGAYIKDLSSVEPDLSKVMILDNSPMSYVFHEDNAIPIQGWISDPGDNDLLNLIPLLESLQYVTDVRALLALRKGEVEA